MTSVKRYKVQKCENGCPYTRRHFERERDRSANRVRYH